MTTSRKLVDSNDEEIINSTTNDSYSRSNNISPSINLSKKSSTPTLINAKMLPSDTESSYDCMLNSKSSSHHRHGGNSNRSNHEDDDSVQGADLEDNFSEEDFDVSRD